MIHDEAIDLQVLYGTYVKIHPHARGQWGIKLKKGAKSTGASVWFLRNPEPMTKELVTTQWLDEHRQSPDVSISTRHLPVAQCKGGISEQRVSGASIST
jgi:predicted NAD/FAD-dependent oxidoreductase